MRQIFILIFSSDRFNNPSYQINRLYSDSLILNKKSIDDISAHFLDLEINIVEEKFVVEVYDKRDNFPFKIVQYVVYTLYYVDICRNVSKNSIIGVFGSQVIIFFKICNSFNGFKKRQK